MLIREGILSEALPQPNYRVCPSFAITVSTAFIFLDYAAHGLGSHPVWYESLGTELSSEERTSLDLVRNILGHGWALRDFIVRNLPFENPAHQNWGQFDRWFGSLTETDILSLINEGIICCLDYYQDRLQPMDEVEGLLSEIGDWNGERQDWMTSIHWNTAIKAALATWQLDVNIEPLLAVVSDPKRFHKAVREVLHFIAKQGFSDDWERQQPKYQQYTEQFAGPGRQENLSRLDTITRLTGVEPQGHVLNLLQTANNVVLVPCPHLYPALSLFTVGATSYVLFEPLLESGHVSARSRRESALSEDDMLAALEVLGDRVRFLILQLVQKHPRIQAVDIATVMNVHPSTVSRHCQQLEQADLVHVAREGNVKHYSVNRSRIVALSSWISDTFGGSDEVFAQ